MVPSERTGRPLGLVSTDKSVLLPVLPVPSALPVLPDSPVSSALPVPTARGEAAAWWQLHGRAVYNYFRFLGANPDAADDLTAETFLRAVRAQGRFDPSRSAPRTWLCRIAQNVWRDDLRRMRVRKLVPLAGHRDLVTDAPSPEERLLWEEQVTALLGAVAELPMADQELIGLRYGSDLDSGAIGEMLNLGEGAVRMRLHRALKRLRQRLTG